MCFFPLLCRADVSAELAAYRARVDQMFLADYDGLSLKFERCIRTKGRDHMQVQLVPLPRRLVAAAVDSFRNIAKVS